MNDAKKQIVDKLKDASNVLVTVSRDPSVDQLAACIGLTLFLNKVGKHTAAVFSGKVPSTLEFLQPEETLEKNTDSLRDFIIALDKSKADKLRYKVEEDVVKIFITPYRTSISEADLDFSQGDFNVDVVIALGVAKQEDLDEAITSHGRILHDATVATLNTGPNGDLGTINWEVAQASSLSELATELAQAIDSNLLDEQIATALLTGVVAETDRFSNDKTSSQTMSISAALMAAGANQQLVASKLEETESSGGKVSGSKVEEEPENGTLEIDHEGEAPEPEKPKEAAPPPEPPKLEEKPAEPAPESAADDLISGLSPGAKLVTEPPILGGTLTANTQEEALEPSVDPLSLPQEEKPMLDHKADQIDQVAPPEPAIPEESAQEPTTLPPPPLSPEPPTNDAPEPTLPDTTEPQLDQPAPPGLTPPPPTWVPPADDVPAPPADEQSTAPADNLADVSNETLAELEESVKKSDEEQVSPESITDVRDEVSRALNSADAAPPETPAAVDSLNAQPLGSDLHSADSAQSEPKTAPEVKDPNAPPPVPPPIPFQFGDNGNPTQELGK
jgi:hypothetical protein